ncbi:integrase core domain-containing protein [Carboxylicivirga marina]|uniref:Transposase n=1 Tax=Carboxylicivirga marina TaxID=2800988 RepID=A0ABS1HR01_9BACT|nr:integrase core domain-containing protein [Carboxylicivirga marina]MBK3519982.1 transposase [Carboxylicivirga marina]
MRKYRSYHTSLKLLAKADKLPMHYNSLIDRSTIWRWKQEPDRKYTSIELSEIETLNKFLSRQEAHQIMSSYLRLALALSLILSTSKAAGLTLKDKKEEFVHTLLRYKHLVDYNLVLRIFRIPTSVFYYWKTKVLHKCNQSAFSLCQKRFPQQLTIDEVSTMKNLALNPQFRFWPVCSLAWYAMRENELFVSLSTWYKYLRKLGINRPRPPKKKRYPRGITATKPNQFWHADITVVKSLDGLKNYVYLLMDNYSKYIINWRVESAVSGKIRVETIKEAYKIVTSKQMKIQLILDGGPENNNKEVNDFVLCEEVNISKLIALKDIPFSNSLIEAQNKLLKYQYLFKHQYSDINQLRKLLQVVITDYNFQRPHNVLKGLTPYEAYIGRKPAPNEWKIKIKQAQQKRIINSQTVCTSC